MVQIHIADNRTDEIIDFIPENEFWNDERIRELATNRDTFDFETFATETYSGALEERNRIIIPNKDGITYSEFIIEEARQILEAPDLHYKATYTSASYLELAKQKILSPRSTGAISPEAHMHLALDGTEWQVGTVDYAENHNTVLKDYTNAYDYILDVAKWSGLELRFRVEHNGYRITGRYVDLVDRAGTWRGFEAVFGENLHGIERARKYGDVVTALIGVGPEPEGNGTRLEVYVENDSALERWGRNNIHLVDVFSVTSDDAVTTETQLRELTTAELTRRITHQAEYVATIETLSEVFEVDPADIQFGDIIRLKDEAFYPPLYLEARVHTMRESIKLHGETEVTLGDYTEFSEADVKSILKRLQARLADKIGNAELSEAIENINVSTYVTQPTPPADLDVMWVDSSKRPYITKVYVEAVEGWVPIMPSTAEEIGADPAGSAEAALQLAREDILEVNDALTGFRNEYDSFMADGFISRAEALSIERHIAALNSEKADIDADYTATYANVKLTGTAKTNLLAQKNAYNTAHANLITAINTAIADGYVMTSEKSAVNTAFAAYATALGAYSTARASAADVISKGISMEEAEVAVTSLEIGGINLIEDATLERGKYLNEDGTMLDDVVSFVTAPISCVGMSHITINTSGKSRWKEVAFYDGAGALVPPFFSDSSASNPIVTVAVPAGALTFRFSSTDYEQGYFKIEKGKKATTWSPSPADVARFSETVASDALASAQEYANAQAELARIEAEVYADGLITDEEATRIADATAKLQEAKEYAETAAAAAIETIDLSGLATTDELDAEAEAIREQISKRNASNILRNSIGYAGMDFWQFTTSNVNVRTIMNEALETMSFGCGFYFPPDGLGKGIQQTVNVNSGDEYTLGWYVQKAAAGSFTIDILQGTSIIATATDITAVGGGFAGSFLTFTPTTDSVTVRFTAAGSAEVTLTGAMLSTGNLPSQWTLASGELYNAYVRTDERGLLVLGIDENGEVESRTVMSPTEFAGYYDENRDGNFDRVFWLNKDETVTKKLRALEEITMGTVKIVRIESANNRGWAFVPIVPET